MARSAFKIVGFDVLVRKFELAGAAAVPAAKKAVFKGAGIVADKARQNLKGVLSGTSSGDLEESLGITPIGEEGGIINARVGFDGYDSNGTPNALKGNVLESGKSNQVKRPFMRPAVRSVRTQVLQAMEETFDNEMLRIEKG